METVNANPLSLSDDDIMNMSPEQFELNTDGLDEVDPGTVEDQAQIPELPDAESGEADEAPAEVAEPDSEETEEVEEQEEQVEDTRSFDEGTEATEQDVESSTDTGVNYKSEYERVLAPFKANGKQIQVDSIDDAIKLMQMGANYNKKMDGLKGPLKYVKMLENNDLLDESKLNYLIDLSKNNPDAVGKLIKDSGLDPLEIDTESGKEYTPSNYSVTDNQVELDQVLGSIKDTSSYGETMQIVGKQWDEASKRVLVDRPSMISQINDQVGSGMYQKIWDTVEKERMMGRLANLSDLEAYHQVGTAMYSGGAQKATEPTYVDKQSQQSKKPENTKLKDRKRSASPTKSKGKSAPKSEFNPLAMSDEEFENADFSKYL